MRAAAGPATSGYNLHLASYGVERGFCDRRLIAEDRKAANLGARLASDLTGARMDRVDLGCVAGALEFAPDKQRIAWRNADSGAAFAVTPVRTYENDRGAYCREYEGYALRGEQSYVSRGVACRQGDGAWMPIK